MTRKPKEVRAAAYRRVSTPGQVAKGESLADQRDRAAAFVAERGWQLVADYDDPGKSGSKDYRTRPAFMRMLADAAAGSFDVLVVLDAWRFSRNVRDFLNVEADLAALGVVLVAMTRPDFDPDNEGDVLGRNVEVVVGQFVAARSRARSIEVRQRKIDSGGYNLGQRIPYGLRWVDKAGTALEHDPAAYAVWRFIMDLRGRGYGYGRIAAVLNGGDPVDPALVRPYGVKLPVANRFGMKIWREGAIASMFRDESRWTGRLEVKFKPVRGQVKTYAVEFPPLMTKAEHDKFAKLTDHNLTWSPRNVGKGSVLSGVCRCGICGARLSVTGNRAYKYYGCTNKLRRPAKGHKRCSLPLIQKHHLEAEVLRRIAEFLGDDKRFDAALEAANVAVGDRKAALAQLECDEAKWAKDAATLAKREDRLADGVTDGLITKDAAQRKRQALDRDRTKIEERRDELAVRRAALERGKAQVERVEQARRRQRGLFANWNRLQKLSDDKKRDLLRSLLPSDGGSGIVVGVAPAGPAEREGETVWTIEIRGLLPVEDAKYKVAVLGGALAVPCTCNPLQQG